MDIKEIILNLDPMSEGDSVNVHHCKEGRSNDRLYIKRTAVGWLYNCFHCGESGGLRDTGTPHETSSRSHVSTNKYATKDAGNKRWQLPRDSTRDWNEFSPHAKSWLRKYIEQDEVNERGILFSSYYNRVVLPVWSDSDLVGYQTRRLVPTDTRPKYLTYVNSTDDFYLLLPNPTSDCICLVEDYLSAVKVARHTASAALFGTNLKDKLFSHIVGNYSKYLIFLDDDNWQVRLSARKIKKRLDIFGECVIISGVGKDPKECSDSELRGVLL